MSKWDGVFRCDELGVDDCVVWWDAVAAVGAWAAATVTLFAVLVPVILNLRKERFRNHLALADYVHDLPEFLSQWLDYGRTIEDLLEEPSFIEPRDLAGLTIDFPVPVLESSARVESILVLLRLLKKDAKAWNRMVEITQEAVALNEKFRNRTTEGLNLESDHARVGLVVLNSMRVSIGARLLELLGAIEREVPSLRSTTVEMARHLMPRN